MAPLFIAWFLVHLWLAISPGLTRFPPALVAFQGGDFMVIRECSSLKCTNNSNKAWHSKVVYQHHCGWSSGCKNATRFSGPNNFPTFQDSNKSRVNKHQPFTGKSTIHWKKTLVSFAPLQKGPWNGFDKRRCGKNGEGWKRVGAFCPRNEPLIETTHFSQW